MNSVDDCVGRCRHLCKRTIVRVFSRAGSPGLAATSRDMALTGELRRTLSCSDPMSLGRILGYRWQEYMSDDPVLREAVL